MKTIDFQKKKGLFLGDSIASGCRDDENGGVWKNSCEVQDGRGWPRRLKLEYGLDTDNLAIGGETLVKTEGRGHIFAQLPRAKYPSYDYVILEGGYNDAVQMYPNEEGVRLPPIGAPAHDFSLEQFDQTTVLGALEALIYTVKERYPNAKFGFVIPYHTPRSTYGGISASFERMRDFWDQVKAVCDKWHLPYLDLFSGCAQDGTPYAELLHTDTTECLPGNGDFTHLTTHGYDVTAPHFATWLASL